MIDHRPQFSAVREARFRSLTGKERARRVQAPTDEGAIGARQAVRLVILSLVIEMAMSLKVWQSFLPRPFPRHFNRQPPWHARRRRASIARAAELFEDRMPLSAVAWIGRGADFDWATPANWSTGIVPGPIDDRVHRKGPVS
jgi:hypothetical protein